MKKLKRNSFTFMAVLTVFCCFFAACPTEPGGGNVEVDVNVEPGFDKIEVIGPKKALYRIGEEFDSSGIRVMAIYLDTKGKGKAVSDYELDTSGFDSSSVGAKTIIVTYRGKTATFDVLVVADGGDLEGVLERLEFTEPLKTVYITGEEFDPTGITVTAVYVNYSITLAPDAYDIDLDEFDSSVPGEKTIYISYGGQTVTFTVTVYSPIVLEQVQTPAANPPSGVYTENTQVRLSTATTGAVIWYTENGANPVPGTSTRYMAGQSIIRINSAKTVKAIAVHEEMLPSEIMTAEYTVQTYAVTIKPSQNGTISVSKSSDISGGDNIMLTITPAPGYKLSALPVVMRDDNEDILSLTGTVSPFTFIMPLADVSVSASFEKIKNGDINITFQGPGNETISLTAGNDFNQISILNRQRLTVTVAASGGFNAFNWYLNGKPTGVTSSTFEVGDGSQYYVQGTYILTVVCWKNGRPYSKEVIFRVVL